MADNGQKEVRKMDEQIELIIRKYPHMEQHIVRTPFGPKTKPSWAKAAEALGTDFEFGKNINNYRRKARAVQNKSNGRQPTIKEIESWELTQEGLQKGE